MGRGSANNDHLAQARALAERVEQLVRDGKPHAAQRVLARTWDDAVQTKPLYIQRSLTRLDRTVAGELARTLATAGAAPPELELERRSDSVAAVRMRGGQVLGFLRAEDARRLAALDPDGTLYEPQLLEISVDDRNHVTGIAVNFKRPELRICSACGAEHTDPHVNCAQCRSKRRRKGPEADSYEPAPVPLHEALEQIASDDGDGAGGDIF
jgi:hypothetical protein